MRGSSRSRCPRPPAARSWPSPPLALVVAREALAGHAADCDAALAVQTLAALPVARAGTPEQREQWLRGLASGGERGAFALTELDSGSDVAALATTATRDGHGYRLDGEKVLISGAPSATVLVVFARASDAASAPITAFLVPATAPGVAVTPVHNLGEHELGTVRLDGVRVPASARLGAEGDGLSLALGALEVMRPTVGAAACGMAARALEETRALVRERKRGGDHPRRARERAHEAGRAGDRARGRAAARLPRGLASREHARGRTSRRAVGDGEALRDRGGGAHRRRVLCSCTAALGVVRGAVVERLYREVRALRIYEGTSEILKLVIARSLP